MEQREMCKKTEGDWNMNVTEWFSLSFYLICIFYMSLEMFSICSCVCVQVHRLNFIFIRKKSSVYEIILVVGDAKVKHSNVVVTKN